MTTNPVADKIPGSPRTFLRIPAALPAAVFLGGRFYKEVTISDISSTGLSFIAAGDSRFPSAFEIRFCLSPFSRILHVEAELKNQTSLHDGIRVGCVFLRFRKGDQERIGNYLDRVLNFSLADNAMFIAAFLCVIDVLWRIIAYLVNGYFIGTGFGRDAGISAPPFYYRAALTGYALASFITAAVTSQTIKVKGRTRFSMSLSLLTISFLYVLWKTVCHIGYGLWNADYLIVKAIFWWEAFLLCYLTASIFISVALFEKVSFVFSVLQTHSSGGAYRK